MEEGGGGGLKQVKKCYVLVNPEMWKTNLDYDSPYHSIILGPNNI